MLSLAVLMLAGVASADIYLHNPRGSNNKLSDDNTAVDNYQRLFNSMNSMWPIVTQNLANAGDGGDAREGGYNAPLRGGSMRYFVGSKLPIEFAIDNGCGSPAGAPGEAPAHCDIVLQYMCSDALRDGSGETQATIPATEEGVWAKSGLSYMYGMHEGMGYYQACAARERNRGLFIGNWAIGGDTARYTRQNRGNRRYGFECPEERDYYPYWAPTPWRDIAIITDDVTSCAAKAALSQNVAAKGFCEGDPSQISEGAGCPSWKTLQPWSETESHISAPECVEAPWIGSGMLSNGVDGYPLSYMWTIPDEGFASCALRVRYNVSMGDDIVQGLDGTMNTDAAPINNDPRSPYNYATCCDSTAPGRCQCELGIMATHAPFAVYQDRSHRFQILPRPASVQNAIHNLNVRGKRGNIVQTFPAVEHDFVPNVLECKENEWIHVQWTGSDNNRNNVAGEGTDQTDRSAIVQIEGPGHNYPISWESQTLFESQEAVLLAWNGLTLKGDSHCKSYSDLLKQNENDREQDAKNCGKLNPASPKYDGGLQKCPAPGVYYYFSPRENNFSNRGQKGMIISSPCNDGESCVNADVRPENVDGLWNPFPTGSAAALGSTSLAAGLVSVVAALALY